MIKKVLEFDVGTALSFVMVMLRSIVEDKNMNHPILLDFVKKTKSRGVLDDCDKCHELSSPEAALRDYVRELSAHDGQITLTEYNNAVVKLQKWSMEAVESGSVWLPVTCPILSVMLYCCFSDLEHLFGEERDVHLDRYSARQAIKALQYSLQDIKVRQKTVMLPLIKKEVKTGCEDVVDEFVFMKKYYYVDLNGKRHANYNSAGSRDKDVDKYVQDTYTAYENSSTGMIESINNITSFYLKDFKIIV